VKKTAFVFGLFLTMIILGFIGYIGIIFAGQYVIDEQAFVFPSASKLVDVNNEEITKLYIENRELVSIDQVPRHVQDAFIAVEDSRFYNHYGLDFKSVLRALYKDIIAGSKVEGASTITQQLAKNIFLTNEKTWLRKTKEAVIAINLERTYSKNKIFEMYLNQIYFGHGAYGIQSASTLYFNKPVSKLSIEEGALLAALPKAPTSYSPITYPEKSRQRRNTVLRLMQKNGYISLEESVRLQGRTLALSINKNEKTLAYATYIDMVLDEAKRIYHLSNSEVMTGGYTIVVPMDKTLQQTSFELFQEDEHFPGTDDEVEAAIILLNNVDGGIVAVQGGRDYVQKGLNRVFVKRQPGSVMKPLAAYAPALEEGLFDPYSLLVDQKVTYDGYTPRNYNNRYNGFMTMYDALKVSANAPAVWVLDQIGVETSKKYLNKADMHIQDEGLAIALGGLKEGVSPLQLAKAYRAFAKEGKMVEPYVIQDIYDRQGNRLSKPLYKEKVVFSKQTAWNMTRMLEAVVKEGTGSVGTYNGALAGKTGTTSFLSVKGANKDAWFVGYTPEVTGALWVGYDRTTEDQYLTSGSSSAVRLFKRVISKQEEKAPFFVKSKSVKELEPPITLPIIDDLTGKYAFKALGFFSIELRWTPSDDKRIKYHVYVNNGDKPTLIDKVYGKGTYTLNHVNILKSPQIYVVPYNPLIEKEGEPSNVIQTNFFNLK
jgi:penicillin-binding protein 2A